MTYKILHALIFLSQLKEKSIKVFVLIDGLASKFV